MSLIKQATAVPYTLAERLELYTQNSGGDLKELQALDEASLTQFLNNHQIPHHRWVPVIPEPLTVAQRCQCAGRHLLSPDDVRIVWWHYAVIHLLRNSPVDTNHIWTPIFQLHEIGYLVRLGAFLGAKRTAAYPTTERKLAEAWELAKANYAAAANKDGNHFEFEKILDSEGIHGDCKIAFNRLKSDCSYFLNHTSW